jgi:type I restriction enzyme, R subunit
MAEYINVGKPFLDKLQLLEWEVIIQGQSIPQEAGKSMRTNFRKIKLS